MDIETKVAKIHMESRFIINPDILHFNDSTNIYILLNDDVSAEDYEAIKIAGVGKEILDHIGQSKTAQEILDLISIEYDIDKDQAKSDLFEFIENLISKNIISIKQ